MNHVHGLHPWTSLLLASELGFCQEEGAATGPQVRKKPFGHWPACAIPDACPAAGVVVLPCPISWGNLCLGFSPFISRDPGGFLCWPLDFLTSRRGLAFMLLLKCVFFLAAALLFLLYILFTSRPKMWSLYVF